jgi:hypothetical protein
MELVRPANAALRFLLELCALAALLNHQGGVFGKSRTPATKP